MTPTNRAVSVVLELPLDGDREQTTLVEQIDWARLRALGLDERAEIFAPAANDPAFGFGECAAANCNEIVDRLGLCWRCRTRWHHAPTGTSFEEFCATAPASTRPRGVALCLVCRTVGHERPVRWRGLCQACLSVMSQRGQSVAEYVEGDGEFAAAAPRTSFGRCTVTVCDRWAHRRDPALCAPHDARFHKAGRPSGKTFEAWWARQGVVDIDRRTIDLRGLTERARLEVLFGLQGRARAERRTRLWVVQVVVNLLRAKRVASVFDVAIKDLPYDQGLFLSFTRDQVTLALSSPEAEAAGDDWDLRVFGRRGEKLHFGLIRQDWLKQAAKAWAFERLDTVERPTVLGRVIYAVGLYSASLCRHREDQGADPSALGRDDLLAFSADLSHLEAAGKLSRSGRNLQLRRADQFLRETRGMGLTRSGGPLEGLADDVVLRPGDRGRTKPDPGRESRGLPQVVLDQLLAPAALRALEATHGPDARTMVELQADVGRRTGELCGLRYDCLAFDEVTDESGRIRPAPVLIHDMPKIGVSNYRLPIDAHCAEIIEAQQARLRLRYPDTATSALALFPAVSKNPRGVKACRIDFFERHLNTWIGGLAELLGPGGEPYHRGGITPYSFRHCFAQRHADSGTPIEVLADLMGHLRLSTTQAYFSVTNKRKRKAVDLLAALQVDRDGQCSRPVVERLLQSDATRDAIGQVAVPFGICTEPTNVKAHGQACPFRHRCFGCTYLRSDPSFLPELRAHLTRLLADKERLRAAVPELEEWARNTAVPSAEEVASVRRIISRCEDLVATLPDGERAEVEEAIMVLRRVRAQLDTSVPVRFRGVIGQPSPRLFPHLERDRGADDDH